MSKKSRRARKKQAIRATNQATMTLEMPAQETNEAVDFSEYRYVITDLRRVMVLAAIMFALLVGLSFFIR